MEGSANNTHSETRENTCRSFLIPADQLTSYHIQDIQENTPAKDVSNSDRAQADTGSPVRVQAQTCNSRAGK